jgi:uncharacterized membrane protein YkvI
MSDPPPPIKIALLFLFPMIENGFVSVISQLYPVTACVVFGCVLAGGYLLRMAVQHPDAA